MERERNFRRKYGITIKQYNEMFKEQNFVCVICGNSETTVDGKNGNLKKFAIDH